jgi:hypothetical protein
MPLPTEVEQSELHVAVVDWLIMIYLPWLP